MLQLPLEWKPLREEADRLAEELWKVENPTRMWACEREVDRAKLIHPHAVLLSDLSRRETAYWLCQWLAENRKGCTCRTCVEDSERNHLLSWKTPSLLVVKAQDLDPDLRGMVLVRKPEPATPT